MISVIADLVAMILHHHQFCVGSNFFLDLQKITYFFQSHVQKGRLWLFSYPYKDIEFLNF